MPCHLTSCPQQLLSKKGPWIASGRKAAGLRWGSALKERLSCLQTTPSCEGRSYLNTTQRAKQRRKERKKKIKINTFCTNYTDTMRLRRCQWERAEQSWLLASPLPPTWLDSSVAASPEQHQQPGRCPVTKSALSANTLHFPASSGSAPLKYFLLSTGGQLGETRGKGTWLAAPSSCRAPVPRAKAPPALRGALPGHPRLGEPPGAGAAVFRGKKPEISRARSPGEGGKTPPLSPLCWERR